MNTIGSGPTWQPSARQRLRLDSPQRATPSTILTVPAGAALPEAPVGATPPREPVSPLPHPAAEARRPTNRLYGWLLLALLVAVAAIRLVHLEADAPHELSYQSLADYTDEGYKTFHARNRVLFGS